jgi:hypothetical protein
VTKAAGEDGHNVGANGDEQGLEAQEHDTEDADDDTQNTNPNATNGGLSSMNMNFQGGEDFNQMQMMMMQQNGMGANSFGGFPMMGM